jgi:4-hydroxy-tetrahydrodipicolinate synthase
MVNLALEGHLDKAASIHYKLLELMIALFEEGSPSGIKCALESIKIAQHNVRLPLVPVSDTLKKRIEGLMGSIK